MANMSYCRFENTYHDLIDCFDNIFEEAENERDERHRKNMIRFLKDRLDEIEELNEELDKPLGMFIDDEEWEKEMGR
jgi:ppGpp synthetase/RelA/SpoT-type nucleotidyltranferase